MTTTSNKRREALGRVAETHDIDPEAHNTAAEDLAALYEHPETIQRWAAVTQSPESYVKYLKTHPSETAARSAAGENIQDDFWAEMPLEVVDLDTGAVSKPVIYAHWPGHEDLIVKGAARALAVEAASLALWQIAALGDASFKDHPEGEVPPEDLEHRIALMQKIARAKRPIADFSWAAAE